MLNVFRSPGRWHVTSGGGGREEGLFFHFLAKQKFSLSIHIKMNNSRVALPDFIGTIMKNKEMNSEM